MMIDTQLILLEGLPSTGKSTNSDFLRAQIERNGKKAKWIHEVTRLHPVLFFSEACLSHDEYEVFLRTYPDSAQILSSIAVFRKNTVGIDLKEIEWNYADGIGDAAFEALKAFDVWNFAINRYEEATLDKWEYFAETAINDKDTVYIMDSSIFQAQIFTFLWDNASYERLERFVDKLFGIVKGMCPSLIYLCRENTEDTIDYLEKDRGIQSLANIWERDKARPYYWDKPEGAEGFKQFLRDYANSARRLFDSQSCRKLSVEISKQDWKSYENEMLSFLEIENTPGCEFLPPKGTYITDELDYEIVVDGLVMIDPEGNCRELIPKNAKEFYVKSLPMVLLFESSEQMVMSGIQINAGWTTTGLQYKRI